MPVFLDFPNSVSMCVLCSLGYTGLAGWKPLFSGLLWLFFVLFIFRGNTIPGKRMAVSPLHPHPLRWQERIPARCAFMRPCQFRACGRRAHGVIHPPRRWQIKSVGWCRKYKLTNHSLSFIILGIEVGTEKCRAHMIKDMSGYPAWHR